MYPIVNSGIEQFLNTDVKTKILFRIILMGEREDNKNDFRDFN